MINELTNWNNKFNGILTCLRDNLGNINNFDLLIISYYLKFFLI